jgi:hypothetical protein
MQMLFRLFVLIIVAGLYSVPVFSQSMDSIKLDYNPRLTKAKSEWLNQHITHRGAFDFTGKNVAFAELLTGGFYGIGKFTLSLHQKHIFIPEIRESFYKLFVLTDEEKQQTKGLDAIFVLGNRKHKGKMRRLKSKSLIKYFSNNYPQIPDDAGKDDNPELSTANAAFFNEIYRNSPVYLPKSFDFAGKKLAIFSGESHAEKTKRVQISEYVQRLRTTLDESGYFWLEFIHILTPEQKIESGGYDVIISYRNKMGAPLQGLIDKLRKENLQTQ